MILLKGNMLKVVNKKTWMRCLAREKITCVCDSVLRNNNNKIIIIYYIILLLLINFIIYYYYDEVLLLLCAYISN